MIQSIQYWQLCLLCKTPGWHLNALCTECIQHFIPLPQPQCLQCAMPLSKAISQEKCGACLIKAPHFDQTIAQFQYDPIMQHCIHQMKFKGYSALAAHLGYSLGLYLKNTTECNWSTLIPVPLHSKRWHERGFNQSLIIAQNISTQINIPLQSNILIKTKNTIPVSLQRASSKNQSVQGAFKLKKPMRGHIALVDDLMTTGTTAHHIATLLKSNGALSVTVLVPVRVI